MMDKLVEAITNVVIEYQPAKASMLQVGLFTPVLVYIARATDQIDRAPQYAEERVIQVLNLLSQLIDGEKPSQDWILNNVKIDQICL